MKTALLAAALIAIGAPAFASTEAPFQGYPTVLTAPSFTTAGTEGAPMFAAPRADMKVATGMPQLALSAEAFVGPRV